MNAEIHKALTGKDVDLCPRYSTHWGSVAPIMDLMFDKVEIEALSIHWNEVDWQCEITVVENLSQEIRTVVKVGSTPLKSLCLAFLALCGHQLPKRKKRKRKKR